jgi:hypothetical protein
MKKLICALMIFLFLNFSFNLAYASFFTSAITRLQPAAAVAGAAGSKIIPAVFSGTAPGGGVSSWISLAIPGGVMGKLVGAALGVAGGLAIDYLYNNATGWFTGHNLALYEGALVNAAFVTYPSGYDPNLFENSLETMTSSYAAAASACEAARSATQASGGGVQVGVCTGNNPRSNGGEPASQANAISYWAYWCLSGCTGGPAGQTVYYWWYYPAAVHQDAPVPSKGVSVSPAQAQSLLVTDLANNNADAVQLGQVALDVTAAALDNPNHPLNYNAAIKAAYQAALLEAVTAQQLADLEAQAVPAITIPVPTTTRDPITYLTPAQIAAAVQAALAGQGLSAAQIALAIAAAQAGASQGLTQAQAQAATAAALTGAGLSATQIATAIRAGNPAATAQEIATAIKITIPPITPLEIATAIRTANPTLTADQVKTAVQEGVTAAKAAEPVVPALGGYAGEAVPAAWHTPAVGNFSTLFSNFLLAMKSTPLFSLPGLLSSSVPSGGECTMSINMGTRFGGTHDFSICNWATGLSAMKAALLCMASIFAVGIVVKGGGG